MRKELLAATALSSVTLGAGLSGQAQAQGYEWTGFYAGGALGMSFNDWEGGFEFPEPQGPEAVFFLDDTPFFFNPIAGFDPWPTAFDLDDSSFVGSVGGGYNFQFGRIVVGFEADLSILPDEQEFEFENLGDIGVIDIPFDIDVTRNTFINAEASLNPLLTFRPRIGFAADRLLIYGTGGLAFGRVTFETEAGVEDTGKGPIGTGSASWRGRETEWRPGFVVGAGGEYAVTDSIRLKLDWLHYDLGEMDVTADGQAIGGEGQPIGPVSPYHGELKLRGDIVRFGINIPF